MEKNYDKASDTMWIVYKDGVEDSYEEIAPGFIMEFNKEKELIGIEIQNFSRFYNNESSPSIKP
ncbi:DUF2283 domain-containing protein [Candidatus Woesebacteria bacterium]|nr:DUF2283 domain-containing protein [Candidatus Woesebacteria bacterium]